MNIKKGQIWARVVHRMEAEDKYFPSKGWKVEVMECNGDVVYERIVEYDGVAWNPDANAKQSVHSVNRFMELYTPSKL